MTQDFRFRTDQQVCGVRATALIVQDGKIYLNRNEQGRFYTIGGAIRCGETTEEAVKREVKEEINLDIDVERLAFVVENTFCKYGVNFHNIEFHYLVKPLGEPDDEMVEGSERRSCEWIELADINAIDLVPAFLKTELTNLSTNVKHIVIMEDRED